MQQRSGSLVRISEPDEGLYDALNKGILHASGDLIGVMCDRFADKSVLSRMADIVEQEGTDGVHGDLDYVDGERTVRKWRMGQGKLQSGWMPGHPTLYLKKEIYETFGTYRTDLRIAADYEFMIRVLKDGKVRLSYLPQVLVHMQHGQGSTSTGGLKNYLHSFDEGRRALAENGMPHPFTTTLMRSARVAAQFIRKT